MNTKKPLVLRDEIHGDISFVPLLSAVIDHPDFQRLRSIKQLGLTEYVFPTATHTRFQHSIGASYLSRQYFETALRGWLNVTYDLETTSEGTKIYSKRTQACFKTIAEHEDSYEYWWHIVCLAALLHDIGHGPWSHTFEFLALEQDFNAEIAELTGGIRKYFNGMLKRKEKLQHEDISILYIHQILIDLEKAGQIEAVEKYFLPLCLLINKGLLHFLGTKVEEELARVLSKFGIRGGVEIHSLVRPIISGPFDVDRMDYIQRDGRNCGVFIGGIESKRIITKLMPCLAKHKSNENEPENVVLISNFKNQHVLDDFIFSLFQMYTQVYLHPKTVGIEEMVKSELKKASKNKRGTIITLQKHRELSDEAFREMLIKDFGLSEVENILLRKEGAKFKATSYPEDLEVEKELKKNKFIMLDLPERSMMKDSMGVFLYSSVNSKEGKKIFLSPWTKVSPVAGYFYNIHYAPRIWIKKSTL